MLLWIAYVQAAQTVANDDELQTAIELALAGSGDIQVELAADYVSSFTPISIIGSDYQVYNLEIYSNAATPPVIGGFFVHNAVVTLKNLELKATAVPDDDYFPVSYGLLLEQIMQITAPRAAILASSSNVTTESVVLNSLEPGFGILAFDGSLSLNRLNASNFLFPVVAAIQPTAVLSGNWVYVEEGEFARNQGGAFFLKGFDDSASYSDVYLKGTRFISNQAGGGADIFALHADVTLEGTGHSGGIANGDRLIFGTELSAPVSLLESTLVCNSCTFTDGNGATSQAIAAAVDGGEVIELNQGSWTVNPDVSVPLVTVKGLLTTDVAVLKINNLSLSAPGSSISSLFDVVRTQVYVSNSTVDLQNDEFMGMVFHMENTYASFSHFKLCNVYSTETFDGNGIFAMTNTSLDISRSVFQNIQTNQLLFKSYSTANLLALTNNTLASVQIPGGLIGGYGFSNLSFTNNALVKVSDLLDLTTVTSGKVGYNLFYLPSDPTLVVGSTDIRVGGDVVDLDPLFTGYDPTLCDSIPQPGAGSPVINAGDPDGAMDDDGTRADIGAYPVLPQDTGGDTQPETDDSGASVDQDGDGVVSGQDCNDSDPEVGAPTDELYNDGIDQDCSGSDAISRLSGGCATVSGASGLMFLAGISVARRRKCR